MKRITSLIVAAILSVSCCTAVLADSSATNAFRDLKDGAWYCEYIDSAASLGYMNGVSEDRFAPDAGVTRAMAVTVLFRLDGSPAGDYSSPFTDLAADWYKDAVAWAYTKGYTEGVGGTRFAPDDFVTREQLATIMGRYIADFDWSDVPTPDWLGYEYVDKDDISPWAIAYVTDLGIREIVEGSISGEDNARSFNPKANCTRAELAKILIKTSAQLALLDTAK